MQGDLHRSTAQSDPKIIWTPANSSGGTTFRRSYTYEEKLAAVQAHLEGGLTSQQAMEKHDIRSKSAFFRWVSAYRDGGPEALKPGRRGRPPKNRS